METLVEVGGVQFHGTDPGGEVFRLVSFEGWSDSPTARGEAIPRPSAHGDFDAPVFRGPRLITMSGWCQSSSLTGLRALKNSLMGILADGESGVITVDEMGEETTSTVRLFGDPRFRRLGASARANWAIRFRAPDPRRYGASNTDGPSSSISVNHAGNFPATSVLTIAGSSGGGYTLTGPGGRQITVTEPLVTGFPHTLDLATGALVVDGDRVIGGITVYEPWTVPVGASVSVSVSAGTVTAVTRDTFM